VIKKGEEEKDQKKKRGSLVGGTIRKGKDNGAPKRKEELSPWTGTVFSK